MPSVPFFFVDVFADAPLRGNPLAVVPDADELSVATMQGIAREFNQSETTFLVAPSRAGADWRLRSFTPIGAEVFGAGHNAMGAWIWLAASGGLPIGERFAQQIGDAILPVEVARVPGGPDVITMDHSAPVFGAVLRDRGPLAAALGILEADLLAGRPAEVVSTGAGHLLVAVRDRAVVDRVRPDTARLLEVLRASGGEGCYVYSLESGHGSAAYARFFNPTVGIAEDPATGTAAGPLAVVLVRDGLVPAGQAVVIEQGVALGRPSRLTLHVAGESVRLSGSGVVVADGRLRL